jgi:hypothetical protein
MQSLEFTPCKPRGLRLGLAISQRGRSGFLEFAADVAGVDKGSEGPAVIKERFMAERPTLLFQSAKSEGPKACHVIARAEGPGIRPPPPPQAL